MTDQLKFDPDFTLPESMKEIRRDFADGLQEFCSTFAAIGIDSGLSRAEACTVVVDMFIQMAAGTACRVRRELLDGEPDYERWRQATDEAFRRAVEYTASEKRGTEA